MGTGGGPLASIEALAPRRERLAGDVESLDDSVVVFEFFADAGSLQRRRALARFGSLMVALLFALIAVLSVRVVWDDYRFEETSPGIGVPQWWYSVWLPIVCTAIGLRAVGLFIRRSRSAP